MRKLTISVLSAATTLLAVTTSAFAERIPYETLPPVPEPATVTLMAVGIGGLAIYGIRRHRNRK